MSTSPPPSPSTVHLRSPASVDPVASPTPSTSTFSTTVSHATLADPILAPLSIADTNTSPVDRVTTKVAACELTSPVVGPVLFDGDCEECGASKTARLGASGTIASTGSEAKAAKSTGKGDFDRFGIPSDAAVLEAGNCELVGESGASVLFSTLVRERERVVVVFLRHLWCGLCQEYVAALKSATRSLSTLSSTPSSTSTSSSIPSADAVTTTIFSTLPPLYILLISSGSPSLIPIYRARLECPFPLYVDTSRKLYKALGMTRKSWSMGRESDKGSYATKSKLGNMLASTVNGVSMPRYPGDQRQLGGEFVFGSQDKSSPIECLFASRMSTTRNHSEVRELFAAAGVSISPEDAASVFGGSSLGGGT